MIDMEKLTERCLMTMRFAEGQFRNLIEVNPGFFPMYTLEGSGGTRARPGPTGVRVSLGGQLWLLYRAYGRRPIGASRLRHYSRLVEHRKTDRTVHDLGFVFWSTWKRWYDLTGEEWINDVVVEAGRTMGLRFKEKGQYLQVVCRR